MHISTAIYFTLGAYVCAMCGFRLVVEIAKRR